ncbi:hypothetical protein ACQKWADRAFT_278461 [Trichoderma austrokoningii]
MRMDWLFVSLHLGMAALHGGLDFFYSSLWKRGVDRSWRLIFDLESVGKRVFGGGSRVGTYNAKSFLSHPVANYTKLLYIHLFPFPSFSVLSSLSPPRSFSFFFGLRVGEKSGRRRSDVCLLGV